MSWDRQTDRQASWHSEEAARRKNKYTLFAKIILRCFESSKLRFCTVRIIDNGDDGDKSESYNDDDSDDGVDSDLGDDDHDKDRITDNGNDYIHHW